MTLPTNTRRLALLGLTLGATSLLGACIVVPAGYPRGGSRAPQAPPDDDGDVVGIEPPPPQNEVIIAAPGPEFFWIAGCWAWMAGRHRWIGGHWERQRPGWSWVPYSWHRHSRGWRAAPGRWQRR